jgi:hypothetical protein
MGELCIWSITSITFLFSFSSLYIISNASSRVFTTMATGSFSYFISNIIYIKKKKKDVLLNNSYDTIRENVRKNKNRIPLFLFLIHLSHMWMYRYRVYFVFMLSAHHTIWLAATYLSPTHSQTYYSTMHTWS